MARNRDAPAYQEYAASMMARIEYRVMPLAARGLLYSMRLECWVNRSIPSTPSVMARLLGYQPGEIEQALPFVLPFFQASGETLICTELESYRQHISDIRERQSEGGKASAARTNAMRTSNQAGNSTGSPTGYSTSPKLTTGKSKSTPVKPPSQEVNSLPTECVHGGGTQKKIRGAEQ
jgi:hypothetical protein